MRNFSSGKQKRGHVCEDPVAVWLSQRGGELRLQQRRERQRMCIHAFMHPLSSSPVLRFGGQSEIAAGVPGHMDQGAWLGSLSGICSGRNPLHSRPGQQGGGLLEK